MGVTVRWKLPACEFVTMKWAQQDTATGMTVRGLVGCARWV